MCITVVGATPSGQVAEDVIAGSSNVQVCKKLFVFLPFEMFIFSFVCS